MKEHKFKAKEAACLLLGSKLFSDYINASSVINGVEIEHFAEDWIARNVSVRDKLMARSVWKCFLENVFNYRKEHRK